MIMVRGMVMVRVRVMIRVRVRVEVPILKEEVDDPHDAADLVRVRVRVGVSEPQT